jgi:hypothetical protein
MIHAKSGRATPRGEAQIGVEPRAYLADVITKIVRGHPQSRLDELLPWAYPTTPALKAAA